MAQEFDAEVVILGMGSAALLTGVELVKLAQKGGVAADQIMLIGRLSGGSSVLSSWYVAQYDPSELETRLIAGLGPNATRAQIRLVEYIASHHLEETERFKNEVLANCNSGAIKPFVDGFSGIAALTGYSTQNSLPGAKVLRYLRTQASKLGARKVIANIEDLERIEGGYRVYTSRRGEQSSFTARRLVIGTGGMAHTKDIATSAKTDIPNVLELVRDRLDIDVSNIDSAVYFPFALRESKYRAGSLLPPSFMTRADIVEERADGSRVDFLSDRLKTAVASGNYRPVFSELVELFTRIRERGSKVLVETRMSLEEFQEYKTSDHYGYVFKGKSYDQALSLSVAPAYHSALGGVCVDDQCASSDPHVFAVGESALVYGTDRPIGGEHVSAITLSPLVSEVISEQLIAERMADLRFDNQADSEDALGALRKLLDRHDEAVTTDIRLDSDQGGEIQASDEEQIGVFVRDVLSRVIWRSTELKRHFKPASDDTLQHIRECDVDTSGMPLSWSLGKVVAALNAFSSEERDKFYSALAGRLGVIELVAPIKQQMGHSIRDADRETQVVKNAMQRGQSSLDQELIGGLYKEFLLPASFEIQQEYRNLFPLEDVDTVLAGIRTSG